MLDLSNNNSGVNFRRVYSAGQRRVYLKLTEGNFFTDGDHDGFRAAALRAGLKVGEYHFARPSRGTPSEEAHYFLHRLPHLRPRHALRPCLDLEDPNVSPSPRIGRWAEEWLRIVRKGCGHKAILYGSYYYIAACAFDAPLCPLWLADYGPNDGREHPYHLPHPWSKVTAHQYTSRGHVHGVAEVVDVSRVYRPRALAVRRLAALEIR